MVHDIRIYSPKGIQFGMCYMDVSAIGESSTPVADPTKINALAPDLKDHQDSGWTEQEKAME